MIEKANFLLLILFLSIHRVKGSEQNNQAVFDIRMAQYNEIKTWATSNSLLPEVNQIEFSKKNPSLLKKQEYFTKLNISNIQKKYISPIEKNIKKTEKDIKKTIFLIIINLENKINNPLKSSIHFENFDTEGSFYFLHKKLKTELDRLKTKTANFNASNFSPYFKTLKDINDQYNKYEKNPNDIDLDIDKIVKKNLTDYYNALFYWFVQKKRIIDSTFLYADFAKKSTNEKWQMLVKKIKNRLIENCKTFKNTNVLQFKQTAAHIIHDLETINIDYQPAHIYGIIKNADTLSQALIDNKNERIKNIPTLFNVLKEWALNNKLLYNNREKYSPENIKNLISIVKKSLLEKYADLEKNYKSLISLGKNQLENYNTLLSKIKELDPKELYELEDAANLLQEAYIFYENITIKRYKNWGIEFKFFNETQSSTYNLAQIIEHIQQTLLKKISFLSQCLTKPYTLDPLLNAAKTATLLTSLKKINTEYSKIETITKNSYINWAVNNGFLKQDETRDKSLETIVISIKNALKNDIKKLPRNNPSQIRTLLEKVSESTLLADLSAQYTEYLNIKNKIQAVRADQEKSQVSNVPITQQIKTQPIQRSWSEWLRSWLPWSSR